MAKTHAFYLSKRLFGRDILKDKKIKLKIIGEGAYAKVYKYYDEDYEEWFAMKKLKGEYIADKKILESLGAVDSDGLEEELDAIRENKNYENISRYINIESIDSTFLEKLKRAISVEDTLSLGLMYEK